MQRMLSGLLFITVLAGPAGADAQGWPGKDRLEAEACTPVDGGRSAASWLARAAEGIGLPTAAAGVVTWTGSETDVQFFQSDRPYPPYLASVAERRWYFAPGTGIERSEPTGPGAIILGSATATYMARDTVVRAVPQAHAVYGARRGLDPFAVLGDFRDGTAVLAEQCTFRGFPRVVLVHGGERLYLDAKSAVPVKLERVEPHPTWGQVRAEYVYTTWWQGDGVSIPIAAVRYVDGVEHLRRDVALPRRPGDLVVRVLAAAEAPTMVVPPADHRDAPDPFTAEMPVDTVRVADGTFLLTTPMYTHAVTLQRDTVFLFDATMADWRSRADSAWVARLFGVDHPVVLVVTDLAWPHVGGVRFWVARGATVLTHRLSLPFLEQLLARRWTLRPDVLEGRRGGPRPVLRGLDRSTTLVGGAVQLAPIDGVASEGALLASVPGAGFLWAGDYIQDVDAPSQYAREVIAAAAREGIVPRLVAAQHLGLTPWNDVLGANRRP